MSSTSTPPPAPSDDRLASCLVAPTEIPSRLSPARPRMRTLGTAAALTVAAGLMVANAAILWTTQAQVRADQRQAADQAKPAQLEATVLVAAACPRCFDPARLLTSLRANSRLSVAGEQRVDAQSAEGKALASALGITRAPAIVLRGEVRKALAAAEFLTSYGQTAPDGRFVVSGLPPPYQEMESGNIRGGFTATYVTDRQCASCYNVAGHRQALAGVGLVPEREVTVDRADPEGKALLKRYGILTVPTLLLQGDLGVYQNLQQVWTKVGTVEADGTYVFRQGQSQMGTYYDLTTKRIVEPPKAEASAPVTP